MCGCNLFECPECGPGLVLARQETRRLTFNRFPSPLPKRMLIKGAYYVGVCRNANIARWDGERFHHWREKWGARFVEDIRHREDDLVFDVFDAWMRVAEEEVKPIPVEGLD